ncbi:hypothetical protein PTKIN_Ptkin01aG0018600 [Pterospermum kingtungense]
MDLYKRLAVGTMVWLVLAVSVIRAQVLAKPGCPDHCGNLSIPYPFGTRKGCFLNPDFHIACNDSTNPSTAFLANTGFVVTNISMDGQLQILTTVARDCYNSSGYPVLSMISWFDMSTFNVSSKRNKFTSIGCDTFAYLRGFVGVKMYSAGCTPMCEHIEDVVDGSCSGFGCCQTDITPGLKNINVTAYSFGNHSDVWDFNHCSYAFIVEESQFQFSTDYVRSIGEDKRFPTSLDWVIGNGTCVEAKNALDYACHDHSECFEHEGMGYLCECSEGFEGNPYLHQGCIDIDECKLSSPCDSNAKCSNLPGSFKCSCKRGYEGDGKINGNGCKKSRFPFVNIALGVSIGLLMLGLSLSWIYWWLRQRKLIKQKEKFFKENGGIILRQEFSKHKEPLAAKIFTVEELKKATNNYHESRILGRGGQGTVYKGILSNGRSVAIKRSVIGDRSQVEQFINEIIVLSQINHRNVVKILGCCLETQVPLLVYEFVSNRTLFDHLHNAARASVLSWENRLRIATKTADVLSYLHSTASTPIIHRDVKLTNILLDENYDVKVSDFGASRLNPLNKAQITTLVQGTMGYLDPEYFQTSQLTEKSDVYSFGVVLIELLTGLKALCFQRPEQERNLSKYFVSMMKKDRLLEILDRRMVNEKNIKPLNEVAALARRCVRLKGEERPTMKEVASALEGLRAMEEHPWGKGDLLEEETENLLDNEPNSNRTGYDGSTSISMEIGSIKKQVRFEIESAR